MKRSINICYAFNEGYVPYAVSSMVSVLHNNSGVKVVFHILTDGLSEMSRQYICTIASQWGGGIRVYTIDDSLLTEQKTTWSKYAWYRIFAADVVDSSVKMILYLDCDVIVCGDITPIFNLNTDDWSVAGVTDLMDIFPSIYMRLGYPIGKGYFCSGVLMMNLDYFRKHNLAKTILEFARNNPQKIQFPDQDALNYVCRDSKITLPLKYGILEPFYRNEEFMVRYRDQVIESIKDPRIIHYAGCAPWVLEKTCHYFDAEFWKYAEMIGGVDKRHCCEGLALLKFRVKCLLGRLGMRPFKKYAPVATPTLSELKKKLNF